MLSYVYIKTAMSSDFRTLLYIQCILHKAWLSNEFRCTMKARLDNSGNSDTGNLFSNFSLANLTQCQP